MRKSIPFIAFLLLNAKLFSQAILNETTNALGSFRTEQTLVNGGYPLNFSIADGNRAYMGVMYYNIQIDEAQNYLYMVMSSGSYLSILRTPRTANSLFWDPSTNHFKYGISYTDIAHTLTTDRYCLNAVNGDIYFLDYNSVTNLYAIKKGRVADAPLDVSLAQTIVTGLKTSTELKIDASVNPAMIYWYDNSSDITTGQRIHRAPVNAVTACGSNTVVTTINPAGTSSVQESVSDLEIDTTNHILYWSVNASGYYTPTKRGYIARVSTLSASYPTTSMLVYTTPMPSYGPVALTIDPVNQTLYYGISSGTDMAGDSIYVLPISGCCPTTGTRQLFRVPGRSLSNLSYARVAVPLPLTLIRFNAVLQRGMPTLEWETMNEKNMLRFEVERSSGNNFSKIGEQPALNHSQNIYRFSDPQPLTGTIFYRLKMINIDGGYSYSNVIAVKTDGQLQVRFYPSILTRGQPLTVQMTNLEKGDYMVYAYNSFGQLVHAEKIANAGGSQSQNIYLPQYSAPGIYQFRITGNKFNYQQSVIVE